MKQEYEYTIDHDKKIIYFPPPVGGPPSWMAYARQYYFRQTFGKEYQCHIFNRKSWEKHIETNEVRILGDK